MVDMLVYAVCQQHYKNMIPMRSCPCNIPFLSLPVESKKRLKGRVSGPYTAH